MTERAPAEADARTREGPRIVEPASRPIRGTTRVPGDKSISHRAAILAALARGESEIRGFSPARDCASTLAALRALGVEVATEDGILRVRARGVDALTAPAGPVDCGRSGTTMRLLAGALAPWPGRVVLRGGPQLMIRPMERVAEPLRRMGAVVETTEGRPPLTIEGGPLEGIRYELPVPSAQVKSAILLAGLRAASATMVVEPVPARDHTERLLAWLGTPLTWTKGPAGLEISVRATELPPFSLDVPGDPSSAAPLLAAAALVPGSDLTIEGVGLNGTRAGFLRALRAMGANVEFDGQEQLPELAGTVRLRHTGLRGTRIEASEIPSLVDEIPLLGVVAASAHGVTEVRGAEELRVKESDRIAGLVAGLRALGADAEELPDGFVVRGPARLGGGECDARGDHRLSMAFAAAAISADGPVAILGPDRVDDSFPGFWDALERLR